MEWNRLRGIQYVRLALGAAERVAPYLGATPGEIDELVIDLPVWPEEIRPSPRKGWDGRLIAGDPLLLDATDEGLLFAGNSAAGVLVRWDQVRDVQVIGLARQCAEA